MESRFIPQPELCSVEVLFCLYLRICARFATSHHVTLRFLRLREILSESGKDSEDMCNDLNFIYGMSVNDNKTKAMERNPIKGQ